jgi:hypothetical protein
MSSIPLAGGLRTLDRGRRAVVHLHWPHWATQIVSDVEHQGPVQMIGFVFAVTLMMAAFLLAVFVLLEAL